jgi:hypothetical protein
LRGQEGGCQAGDNPRTIDLINKSHERLIELYPDFVKYLTKDGKIRLAEHSELNGFKRIKVMYNNAHKSASVGRLNFE